MKIRMRKPVLFRWIAAILLVVPLLALGLSGAQALFPANGANVALLRLPDLRKEAAFVDLPTPEERSAVIVSVFASWCASCVTEHSLLLELKKKYDLPLYGIAWRDAPEAVREWLKKYGDPYRAVGYDRTGTASLPLKITGVPETLVLDSQGRILYRHRGPLTMEIAKNMIAPALSSR